jgi:elongation factor 1-beta
LEAVKTAPDAKKYPHASRWFNHIKALQTLKATFPGVKKAASAYGPAGTAAPAAAPAKKEEEEEDDNDIDLFGSDSEEDDAKAELTRKRLEEYNAKKALSEYLTVYAFICRQWPLFSK